MSTLQREARPAARRAPRRRALALCVAAAIGTSTVHALEWTNTPLVQIVSSTDDNFRLRLADEREVTSRRVDARTSLVGASERVRVAVTPRVNAIEYSDERELDRRDKYLATSLDVGNDRRRWSLGADFSRDGTLTNAFDGSGFFETDLDRDLARYSVGWTGLTGERGRASLALSNQLVRYEKGLISPFYDYDYAGLSFVYAHRLSERTSIELGLSGSQLESDRTPEPTDYTGMSIAFAGDLSETLEYRIGFGAYRSRRPGIVADEDTKTTADLSLAKRWERWRVTATLAAAVEPSAWGVFYRRESFGVSFNHRFSETLSVGFGLAAGRIESDEPLLRFEERDYAAATFNLDWRFAERLSLTVAAGTREQQYFNGPIASGTYGQIGLVYRGRGS